MLVKTPAVTMAVEVRETDVSGSRVVMNGVVNSMPCSVEFTPKELLSIAGKMFRPSVLRLMMSSVFRNGERDK